MLIFGGPKAYEDKRRQKLTYQDVNGTAPATLVYLCWSERPITFDRSDHPDHVVKAGQFLLVISPMIENVRKTKVLMDCGSDINILYKDTFDKLKIDLRKLHVYVAPFHRVVPGRCVWAPSSLWSPLVTMSTTARRRSCSRWLTSTAPNTPSLGGHVTPSSWLS
jgi:hypothetical protein